MDDGLKSLPSAEMAIDLLKRTQDMLAGSNLKLHKLASNSKEVMGVFPSEDYANSMKELDLGVSSLPMQRSLLACFGIWTQTASTSTSKRIEGLTLGVDCCLL